MMNKTNSLMALVLSLSCFAQVLLGQDFHINYGNMNLSSVNSPREIGFTNGLGNLPSAVAQFDWDTTDTPRGMLAPRMTSAERVSIASPTDGLLVYDLDGQCFYYWDASIPNWVKLLNSNTAPTSLWSLSGSDIFNTSFRQVGVGLNAPTSMLHVEDLSITTSLDAAQRIDFANGAGSIATLGLEITSLPLTNARGTQVGVRARTSSNNTAAQRGSAQGQLGTSKSFSGDGSFLGVYGGASATQLNNGNNVPCRLIGGQFIVEGTTNVNLNGSGTYYVAGTRAELRGTINGNPPNGEIGAVVGIDNNQGNAQSYAGHFFDSSFSGTIVNEAAVRAEFNVPGLITQDIPAVLGVNNVEDYWGVGVRGIGGAIGVHGINEADGSNSGFGYIGVQGDATFTPSSCGNHIGMGTNGRSSNFNENRGISGLAKDGLLNYGVYGEASSSCASAVTHAGFFNGTIVTSGIFSSSDRKLKKNIKTLDNATEKIMALRPTSYDYEVGKFSLQLEEEKQYGFIAQELQKVFPTLVKESAHTAMTEDKNGKLQEGERLDFLTVNYVSLIPILTKGLQEQQLKIEDLETKNEDLEARLERLEALINERNTGTSTTQTSTLSSPKLQQNQPNPFHGNTSIQYFIPESVQAAHLQLTDIQGRILKQIIIEARGKGETILETAQLSVGSYYYSLVLDGKVFETKQMMLADR